MTQSVATTISDEPLDEPFCSIESAKRRRRHKKSSATILTGRIPLSEHQQKQFGTTNHHNSHSYHHNHQYQYNNHHHQPISDCDNGHSSYEDDDILADATAIDVRRYGRRKRKLAWSRQRMMDVTTNEAATIFISAADAMQSAGVADNVIPRSIRFRQLLDRIRIETQKAKSKYILSIGF